MLPLPKLQDRQPPVEVASKPQAVLHAAKLLFAALKRAGTTESAALRDAIAATRDFNAVTGKITIDKDRNATKSAVILTVKDGKFAYVETVEP